MSHSNLKLVIGGSREGADYKFVADAESLRRLASDIIARLDGQQPRPWKADQSVIICEEATHDGRRVFLSFQVKDV